MIKRFTILLSILVFLAGCNPPTQQDVIDQIPDNESNVSGETASDGDEVAEGKCPDPAIPGALYFGHHVEQNYMGNNMASDANGSVPLVIGTKGVNGNGTMTMALSGSFPQGGCVMSGSNSANIDINGVCKDGMLELMITETYLGGNMTMTCKDGGGTSAIPGTTATHEISMPLKDGHTVTAPFVGEAGSGNYNWTLSLLLGDDSNGDDIEPVPLTEPDDNIEPVPLVPTPSS
ncbi:hypothetical protein KKA33_01535 [Patescibacteria group bacterium]|nr:hypothetical protein [Patescibacteria group bacterium]